VVETDETNNAILGGPIDVVLDVDLVMTDVTPDGTLLIDSTIPPISTTVKNQGRSRTTASHYIGLYLSTDATVTTTDTLIGIRYLSGWLNAGASDTVDIYATVPASLTPGNYHIGAIADLNATQPESDETNNELTGAQSGVYHPIVPDAPTNPNASGGNAQATVSFTQPTNGGPPVSSYTVTSAPGGITATGNASPITVTGLTNGTAYTFTVTASNAIGDSPSSIASNSVTLAGAAQAYFIHTDHLNTPREITDTSGNTVWEWQNIDPFGGNIANDNPTGAGQFSFNLRFPGQYFDQETLTHYNFYRDAYDPDGGRYTQSDPIGLWGGLNTYSYVNQSPVMFVDPLGLRCNGKGCWTTAGERSFLNKGDYLGYYQAACSGGDAYACFAQHIAADDNLWGHLATNRLTNALEKYASDSKQCIDESAILKQIRTDLANSYANYLPLSEDKASFPVAEEIAKFHWDVFAKFGLPSDTFGGTPFGKTPVLPSLWCPNCR